jgi:F-type H+-transporting ATPase subunit gamma
VSLQELRNHRCAVEGVRKVVSAMRATAAGRIQAAQRAMSAARQYREVVVRALAAADLQSKLPVSGSSSDVRLLIVLMSEQPLCGGFNHAVIDRAIAAHRELSRDSKIELVAVGQRGSRVMTARGLTPNHTEPGSTSIAGLQNLIRRLAARVDHGYAAGEFATVSIVYARYRSVSEQVSTLEQVLPMDSSVLPRSCNPIAFCRYLPDPQLIAGLVSQFAYISLYHAAAESYASEQASRLVAMDGATRNTDRMVDELIGLERRERQHDITRQMLELNAGRFVGENR